MKKVSELLVDRPADDILRLRLNRPERLNAVNMALVGALIEAFERTDARTIVLGSSTPRAFCAGADLDLGDAERAEVSDLLYELYEKMIMLPVPIVVALGGHAVGAGVQLAVAGDLRVAGPEATLRVAGPGHGLAVAAWGLPSLVGRGRAMDLCINMRTVEAEEALSIGLIDRLEQNPEEAAVGLASGFSQLDSSAVGRVKRVIAKASGCFEALREERSANRVAWSGSVTPLLSNQEEDR